MQAPQLTPAFRRPTLRLALDISDPEVVSELEQRVEGHEREAYAANALRLGVLAVRQASGALDAGAIRREGDRIVGELREVLVDRTAKATEGIGKILGDYFEPGHGSVPQRLDTLTKKGGELEVMLSRHLDGDASTIGRTLAQQVGAQSPVFKLLSPEQKNGLIAKLASTLDEALLAQRDEIVGQFSLDRSDSALSRLVEKLEGSNGKLHDDLSEALDEVLGEFSLDNESGALARLRKEVMQVLEPLVESNHAFQSEVRSTLETFKARKEEAARSTRHGLSFEAQLGDLMRVDTERAGDVFEDVSTTPGRLSRKVGDFAVRLGPESAAPGAGIVIEAKANQSYNDKKVLEECAIARENRDALVCVFVFDERAVPEGTAPLRRIGPDIVVLWNPDDDATDVYLRGAMSVAKCLVVRSKAASDTSKVELDQLDSAIASVSKHSKTLDDILKWARAVQKRGGDILKSTTGLRDDLVRQIEDLEGLAEALREQLDPTGAQDA